MIVDDMRRQVEAAGFTVSCRGDISERAAAVLLGRKPKTLRNWRALGRGPQFDDIGGRVFYRLEAILIYRLLGVAEI